jgi:hypothetical protein
MAHVEVAATLRRHSFEHCNPHLAAYSQRNVVGR